MVTSTSGSNVKTNVPEDLVLQSILPRLPVKSLIRFASVRKSWSAYIKSPNFIAKHLHLFTGDPNYGGLLVKCWDNRTRSNLLSFISSSNAIVDLNFPYFREDARNLQVLHCNGVFCLHNHELDDVFLWNPATGEAKIVLTRPVWCAPSVEVGFGGIGFGYDRASGDYKIIRILNFGSAIGGVVYAPRPPLIDVYSLAGDCWEERDVMSSGFPESCYLFTQCGGDDQIQIYSNGIYHWLAEIHDEDAIVSFDLSEEAFLFAPMPPEIEYDSDEWDETPTLAVVNESVAAIYWCYRHQGYDKMFGVWLLDYEGGYGNWTKQLSIGPLSGIHRPLTFCRKWNSELEFDLVLQRSNGQLVSYDFCRRDVKNVSDVEWSPISFQVMVYVESLVSFNQE